MHCGDGVRSPANRLRRGELIAEYRGAGSLRGFARNPAMAEFQGFSDAYDPDGGKFAMFRPSSGGVNPLASPGLKTNTDQFQIARRVGILLLDANVEVISETFFNA